MIVPSCSMGIRCLSDDASGLGFVSNSEAVFVRLSLLLPTIPHAVRAYSGVMLVKVERSIQPTMYFRRRSLLIFYITLAIIHLVSARLDHHRFQKCHHWQRNAIKCWISNPCAILLHIETIASNCCRRFVIQRIHVSSLPVPTHPSGALLDWDLMEAIWTLLCSLWVHFSFVMWHIILLEAAVGRWYTAAKRGHSVLFLSPPPPIWTLHIYFRHNNNSYLLWDWSPAGNILVARGKWVCRSFQLPKDVTTYWDDSTAADLSRGKCSENWFATI